jgi:hypothetical protein
MWNPAKRGMWNMECGIWNVEYGILALAGNLKTEERPASWNGHIEPIKGSHIPANEEGRDPNIQFKK